MRKFLGMAVAAVLAAGLLSGMAVAGYASIIVDHRTGEVVSQVNPDQVNHPASLAKLMTLYMAFEAMKEGRLTWDQKLPVSRNAAAKIPTKLGLRAGDKVSVADCVKGMIVHSANDAATVLGEALAGGSEEAYGRLATEKARALGLSSTVLRNPSGLHHPAQVTTARDMVKLATALYRDFPERYPLFAIESFKFRGRLIRGHNRLMYRYDGMDGLKTGFTNASGWNLVSSAERGGRRLFGAVLGGTSPRTRDATMEALLNEAFGDAAPAPLAVAAVAPPKKRGTAKPAPSSAWTIQVGAFARQADARKAADRAAAAAGPAGRAQVAKAGPKSKLHRALVAGFASRHQAQEACQAVERQGTDCVVLKSAGARAG